MDSFSCDECRAIYQEFSDAYRAAREYRLDQNITPERLDAWLQQPNEDEFARIRESSPLWKVRRRLEKHRVLTGHAPHPRYPIQPELSFLIFSYLQLTHFPDTFIPGWQPD